MLKLLLALMLCSLGAFSADITGSWEMTVETNQGAGTPTVEFKQSGEKLTGIFHSQIFGDVKIEGTVKGDVVEFAFVADAGGQSIKVSYKGKVESPATMRGTAVYAGIDDKATWTAKRK
jgi:hypothetical protein